VSYRAYDRAEARPPRRWRIVAPAALVLILAGGGSGFWFYAAGRAQDELAAWRVREAAAGREVSCASESISGFPFRLELRCSDPALNVQKSRLALNAKSLLAAVQIYQPNLTIAEFGGPLTATDQGRGESFVIDWTLAQASLRGRPTTPERISVVLDAPSVARAAAGTQLARAQHAEAHLREAPRLPQDPPAFDLALSFTQAHLPTIPRLPDLPIDADMAGTLRGLTELSAKPWPQLLRDLQAANGRLDVTQAHIRQGDILAVGRGTLRLTPRGALDGEMQLTIAGLEQLMTVLGIDKAVGQASQNALSRLAPGLNLDRLLGPGGNAALAAAGAAMLGQPAELEGRQAVALPLRFADGVVFLGPVRVGELAPLF
jgi:hypothetical protein